jgi:hypothetical protein
MIKLSEREDFSREDPSKPLIENEAYRHLYKGFSVTINEETVKEIDEIMHNTNKDGREYRYGLPSKNEINYNELMIKPEEENISNTPNQNLFELLELDKLSSYESMLIKIKEIFNHGKIYL